MDDAVGINELSQMIPEVTDLILPWLGVLISIVIFLWFKDFATQLAKGLAFKHDPHFQEGDLVWLEDEPATIIKIGATQTIFGIVNGRGMIWRFVPNSEIHNVKLEKIVSDKIHYDSDQEQARQLRELLELTEEQVIVNIQGDLPMVFPEMVDELIKPIIQVVLYTLQVVLKVIYL